MPKPVKPLPRVATALRPPAATCQLCGLVIPDERRSTEERKRSATRRRQLWVATETRPAHSLQQKLGSTLRIINELGATHSEKESRSPGHEHRITLAVVLDRMVEAEKCDAKQAKPENQEEHPTDHSGRSALLGHQHKSGILCLTPELSDAGGPRLPNAQAGRSARIRSSDFVRRQNRHCFTGSELTGRI